MEEENIKEEYDYKSLSRRLDIQLEGLIAELKKQHKVFPDELQRIVVEAQDLVSEAEKNYSEALEGPSEAAASEEIAELKQLLQNETNSRKAAEQETNTVKAQLAQCKKSEAAGDLEILKLRKMLEEEAHQKEKYENEIMNLRSQLLQLIHEAYERNGDRASAAKHVEQVGLHEILTMFESEDADARIHAVKALANLAADDANQKKIVEAGGITSLFMLLRRSKDNIVRRVAAGAIANLAMYETNQELITSQGGISLLSNIASDADDPQTLRMVAAAFANLCGNDKLQKKLHAEAEGCIKALLGVARCAHPEVIAQVAPGIASFAKCESRAALQGSKSGKSLLIDNGALRWVVQNANNEASPIRRQIELALCNLARNEANANDMSSSGALLELVRISRDSTRADIRTLAHRTLTSSAIFKAEMRRLHIDC